ncbi:alpha-L-fucosidase [Streptomyces sp. NBC_00046]|uniref:alpha-L-fucosidase n=1 Tax=unclassified Streptomyces TaxID=2593676 RepID=UPI00324384D2
MTDASTDSADSPVRTGWFEASRFGLFVHFGLYSLAARHEWVRSREAMSQQEYDRYLYRFDPDLFDARQLARTARESGMRYAVLTAKHHDGFCLFDSALSDYTSVRATGRDLVREFVEAMRAEGLRVGLYYSLLDWHHPDFTVDEHHPLRDTEARRDPGDMARYRAYMEGQLRELLTDYGPIDLLFFDFTYPEKGPQEWGAQQLHSLARELQPGILVNDRLGIPGDYVTPEQYQPDRPLERGGERVVWEACHTLKAEASTWCWAPHERFAAERGDLVPDPDEPFLDLGAAEVASLFAWTDHVLGPRLDRRMPGLRRRLRREVERRVLLPFERRRDWRWIGADGGANNWNPWIHGAVLAAAPLLCADDARRARLVQLVVHGLDHYVVTLPDDGGIDEGIARISTTLS